jgi:hypothetical protein
VPTLKKELLVLRRRIDTNNQAIGFCTCSGLSVCLLVVSLFIGNFLTLALGKLIAGLFVIAMLLLIVALLLFLREVQLATKTFRITQDYWDH